MLRLVLHYQSELFLNYSPHSLNMNALHECIVHTHILTYWFTIDYCSILLLIQQGTIENLRYIGMDLKYGVHITISKYTNSKTCILQNFRIVALFFGGFFKQTMYAQILQKYLMQDTTLNRPIQYWSDIDNCDRQDQSIVPKMYVLDVVI